MYMFEFAGDALAVGAAVLGAALDLRSRRIPNWLTFPGMLLGLLLGLASGRFSQAAGTLGICLLAGFLLWLLGCFGEGDAKLFAALGALAGADAAFLGLALSLPLLLLWAAPARLRRLGLRGWLGAELAALKMLLVGARPGAAGTPFEPLPFAPFLCAGFVAALALLRTRVV
ncbi:prepilin peptidase [Desulfovirgula thermocuniculi]|uniref:prepilin peptidase n=1 Tax=Desulfovirgula thermocuniculi TaxID=348842 RepID=UPI00041F938A|nr:prepilin peptidase [Desulfovirgula thermocuniculi]